MMTHGIAVFIAACLGVLVLEMTLILGAIAVLLLRVSRAVQAVERVTLQVEEKFASIRTSWMRVFQGVGGILSGFASGRRHARAREDGARLAHR